LNLFSMKIGIKEEVKEKIFEIIQDSYYTDIEFVNIKGGKYDALIILKSFLR